MKKLVVVPIVATALLVLSGCGPGSGGGGGVAAGGGDPESTYAWDMTVTTSETSSWYQGADRFSELVADRSDGRIVISVFANDQLSAGDALAGVEQLMNGDKALSYNSAIQLSGIDDRFSAIAAPFTFDSYEQVDLVVHDTEVIEAYGDLASQHGMRLLGFGENGFRQISNNVRPISAPDDLRGLKLRTPGSALFIDLYQMLGADPTVMSFNELFTSLQTGTVDGQENSIDLLYANGLVEVQEYLTVANYIYDPLLLLINDDLFESLSPEDRAILEESAAEANAFQVDLIRELERQQLSEISNDIEVHELTAQEREAFREAIAELYVEWEGTWTPELYSLIQPD